MSMTAWCRSPGNFSAMAAAGAGRGRRPAIRRGDPAEFVPVAEVSLAGWDAAVEATTELAVGILAANGPGCPSCTWAPWTSRTISPGRQA